MGEFKKFAARPFGVYPGCRWTRSSTAPTPTTSRAGPKPVIEKQLDQGALGLITTHDLALVAIADAEYMDAHPASSVESWIQPRCFAEMDFVAHHPETGCRAC